MSGVALKIEVVQNVTAEVVAAIRGLLPELSSSSALSTADLEEIVNWPSNRLLIARDGNDGQIVGTATLVLIRIPSGRRARLESLVVDPATRGRGVGEA